MISNCPVTDDTRFDPLTKVVSVRLLCYKCVFLHFLVSICREVLQNFLSISFFIKLSMYSVIYLCGLVVSHFFNIICCCNNLFWCSNYLQFSQWKRRFTLAGFYILLTCSPHSLSTWFLAEKDVPGSSCTFPGNSHLSKVPWFPFHGKLYWELRIEH